MRIIQVSEFNYNRGGAYKYFLDITQKLRDEGHEVAIFCMHHPKNNPSEWSKYFVSRISFNEATWRDTLVTPFRILYSFEAARKFKKLIRDFKPDIIHVHNIYHQISPSILPVAKKFNIPVVMHLHDYKLICPNYQMFSRGRICEECAAPSYYKCFFKKCFQDSYAKSLLVTLEMYLHHKILKIYEKNIDRYIAPSQFMKDMCVKHGVPADKIDVVYNFTKQVHVPAGEVGDYVLYLGRLSSEKGLRVLIDAMPAVLNSRLIIAGSGPEMAACQALIDKKKLADKVGLTGHLSGQPLDELISRAKAIVIPSVWYENMPFAMLEALALGKIVIASRIGGMPEIIKEGVNGYLFTAGQSAQLAEIINRLQDIDVEKMNLLAKKSVEHLTINNHYQDILKLYQSVCH